MSFTKTSERDDLFEMIQAVDPLFKDLLPVDKFAYLITLTHCGRDRTEAISQTIFSNALSCMKTCEDFTEFCS